MTIDRPTAARSRLAACTATALALVLCACGQENRYSSSQPPVHCPGGTSRARESNRQRVTAAVIEAPGAGFASCRGRNGFPYDCQA